MNTAQRKHAYYLSRLPYRTSQPCARCQQQIRHITAGGRQLSYCRTCKWQINNARLKSKRGKQ